jgi:hypothetical protein
MLCEFASIRSGVIDTFFSDMTPRHWSLVSPHFETTAD